MREPFAGLGPALRWLRRRRSLSQKEVAAASGLSKGRLSDYESGRLVPKLPTLGRILVVLDTDLTTLAEALAVVNATAPRSRSVGAARAVENLGGISASLATLEVRSDHRDELVEVLRSFQRFQERLIQR